GHALGGVVPLGLLHLGLEDEGRLAGGGGDVALRLVGVVDDEGAEDLLALTVLPGALPGLDRELAAVAGDLRVGVLVVAQAEDPVDARADRLVAVLGVVDR